MIPMSWSQSWLHAKLVDGGRALGRLAGALMTGNEGEFHPRRRDLLVCFGHSLSHCEVTGAQQGLVCAGNTSNKAQQADGYVAIHRQLATARFPAASEQGDVRDKITSSDGQNEIKVGVKHEGNCEPVTKHTRNIDRAAVMNTNRGSKHTLALSSRSRLAHHIITWSVATHHVIVHHWQYVVWDHTTSEQCGSGQDTTVDRTCDWTARQCSMWQ